MKAGDKRGSKVKLKSFLFNLILVNYLVNIRLLTTQDIMFPRELNYIHTVCIPIVCKIQRKRKSFKRILLKSSFLIIIVSTDKLLNAYIEEETF
jgi:hypothetical protein